MPELVTTRSQLQWLTGLFLAPSDLDTAESHLCKASDPEQLLTFGKSSLSLKTGKGLDADSCWSVTYIQ